MLIFSNSNPREIVSEWLCLASQFLKQMSKPLYSRQRVEEEKEAMIEPHNQYGHLLFNLPLDIFQVVTSFLEPSDLMCLGLTCTAFWSLVTIDTLDKFRLGDAYWLKQRERFLEKLAGDSWDMILCEDCLKLQPLHAGRPLTVCNNRIKPPCRHLASYVSICKHFSITRGMLELRLKSWRSGDLEASSSSDPFAHSCTWRMSGSGSAECALSVNSKIIEGDLYLKVVYDIDVKLDAKGNPKIPSMRGKGCLHSGIWLKEKCASAVQCALKGKAPCAKCAKAQRCTYCFTQFLVSVTLEPLGALHLQVKAYRYLGGGKSGGASSKHAWTAQTRQPVVAKQGNVHFHPNHGSLEDVFEQNYQPNFVSSPRTANRGKDAEGSPAARPAGHDKYWRPPSWWRN
ncbi:hypothetical protein GJ744_009367 [Endocarpon pusillum]|uniref:F-box domain-containing protein n=1 Tax=Endocarpon pusillum TaxID=364733 RepID=A0A8H7E699_9EURO|nr:hypothetical protein GJ744_009367 [Endocarpon pusillum]